jgi:hypothetical protein
VKAGAVLVVSSGLLASLGLQAAAAGADRDGPSTAAAGRPRRPAST